MSQTILFKDGLRIGKAELELLQSISQEGLAELASALSGTLPAVLSATGGTLTNELRVSVSGTSVAVAEGSALLADGSMVSLEAPVTVAVPDPITDGKVVLTAGETSYAPGTLEIDASNRLTLTYTVAAGSSKVLTDFYQPNGYIRLYNSATSTSLGSFRIESVSAGEMVLAEAVPGSTTISGLKHAPAGKFFPGYPVAGETTDLRSFVSPVLSVQSSSYVLEDNEVVLARVTRSGASVTVTDARPVFRPRGISNITNDMVAENASIAESKLALSPALLLAKALAGYWRLAGNNQLVASTSDLFVTRGGSLKRVLVEGDATTGGTGTTPAFAGLSVSPASASVRPGATQALTAAIATVQNGASPSYTFTSSNPAVATVSASGANATVTGVAEGSTTITVRATAAAVGSFTAASETVAIPITVSASTSTPILTALTLNPASLTLNVSNTGGTSVTASVTSPTSPSVTWLWELLDQAGTVIGLSATNTATVTITPKVAGVCRVRVTASAVASGSFSAATLTAELPVAVSAGLTLLAEPGYRVWFERSTPTSPIIAYARWGIGGTYTASGLTATLSIGADDASVTFAANQLVGQGFFDSNGTMYLITANTASSASPCTVTLSALSNAGANPPVSGTFVIRSVATRYYMNVLSADESTLFLMSDIVTASTRQITLSPPGVVPGSSYKFRLVSSNGAATPSFYNNDQTKTWGTSSTTSVNIPLNWITTVETQNLVAFSWNALQDEGYDPTTMDYYVQWQINNGSWSQWYRVADEVLTLSTLTWTVNAPSSSTVRLRLKITNLSGISVNNTAYDAEAVAATLPITGTGTPTDKVYPITLTSSTTWTEIIPGSGRYVRPLIQYDGTSTSFTTRVGIERIDLSFATAALAQATGTAAVKVLVYPTNNPAYSIAGTVMTEGDAMENSAFFGQTGWNVPIQANQDVTVALEYVASGNPNTLDPTGIGYAKVFFSPVIQDGTNS